VLQGVAARVSRSELNYRDGWLSVRWQTIHSSRCPSPDEIVDSIRGEVRAIEGAEDTLGIRYWILDTRTPE
jgi:hypothetical protein